MLKCFSIMKRNKKIIIFPVLLILFCFLIIFSCKAESNDLIEIDLSDELHLKEIYKDTFLVTHSYPWPGNSLLVRMDNSDFVWIDTPYNPEATACVIDWLYDINGTGVKITEINTGFHIDNLGGNSELIKNNIPVYGSQLTCELLRTRSKETMSEMQKLLDPLEDKKYLDEYSSFKFTEPTHVFDINDEQILNFGKETVEIYYPGPTHTYDNLVVYIPSKRILFGGCMVLSLEAEKVGYAKDGNIEEWPLSLERVMEKYKNAEIVVPGHGDSGDISLIEHTIMIIKENTNY
jgi:metallo-beta-lactamase class B